jgi:3-hydroxybutyryl-CoA dehydrogenase
MQIVVLGNPTEEKLFAGNGIEKVHVSNYEAMLAVKTADAYFDFSVSDNLHWSIYEQLSPALVFVDAVTDPGDSQKANVIRMNGWAGFMQNGVVELSGEDSIKPEAEKIISKLGYRCEWVPNQVGLVSPRVLAMIVNEAYFALGEKVSTKKEIDTAMKLGTNYPMGPFEWSEKIGLKKIYALLIKLQGMDDRYVVSTVLEAEAKANI